MKQIGRLLVGAILLVGWADKSRALTETFYTLNPQSSTLTDWTYGALFPQFNSSLGTLQSVQIEVFSNFKTSLMVTNNSLSSSSGTAKTEVQFTVQDLGNNLTAPELDLTSPTYSYSLAAGQGSSSGLLVKSGTNSMTYTSLPVLSEFTGAGNISLNASTFTQTLLANTGGNTAAAQVTDASFAGFVTYTYIQPTPEPATLALATVGGFSILLLRRRR